MKKMKFTYALILGLALVSFAFISATSLPAEEKQEVLLVEINFSGMYIFESDKPTMFISLNSHAQKRNIEANGQAIQSKLHELYAKGWKLEGACANDQGQRFILVK